MKNRTIYMLQIAVALMLCLAMAGCRTDDFANDDEGTLPPGSHPLALVASVGSMTSRSEGKNSWKNGDQIGVRTINLKGRKYSLLGCYSLNKEGMLQDVVRRYSVGEDGTWTEFDDRPLEWPYPKGKVSAWYPFEPQVDVALDNQAERGFDHLDFLSVTTDEKSYKDVVNLEFKHRMAKVTCRVIPGDGITPGEFETLWLKLQGHTSCTFRETDLIGGENIGWITPDSTYSYTDGTLYEALLVPNEMEGKDLIKICLNTTYEGQTIPKYFSYPSPKIEGGMHYTYNFIVKKDRIEVTFFTAEWDDKREEQHAPTQFTFRVNLTDDLIDLINIYDSRDKMNVINTNLVELSDNVTPIKNTDTGLYDKFDVTGNEFTMSIVATKETRAKNLVVIANEAINNPRVVTQKSRGISGNYIENNIFLIADETTLGYEGQLNVGDFFFSDGSWSSILGWEDVECVGIVFAVNENEDLSVFNWTDNGLKYEADNAENYNYTNTDGAVNPIYTSRQIHGYVLALEDTKRWDFIEVKKTLNKGASYQAGTLEYDTRVVVEGITTTYPRRTDYSAGTLPYDVKAVIGSDTTLYKKGTDYPAGTLSSQVTVIIEPDTTIYAKGTSYPAGKLITNLNVSSLNVPNLVQKFPWSPSTSANAYYGELCSLRTDLFNGFANMVSVKNNKGKTLQSGSMVVPPFEDMQAFASCEGYEAFCKAPDGTSGWYLPSIKQLHVALGYIHTFSTHLDDSPIIKAGGITPDGTYWSSTAARMTESSNVAPGVKAHYLIYQEGRSSIEYIVVSASKCVRAVLTF